MAEAPGETMVLAVNSGSSSLKLALYSFRGSQVTKLAAAEARELGGRNGRVRLQRGSEPLVEESKSFADAEQAAHYLTGALLSPSGTTPVVVGHRIVHGGANLREHQIITPAVLKELESAVEFAPLHLPASLGLIRQAMLRFPQASQVACFDTAFHRTTPEHAARFPLPQEFWDRGLRRYGFHGLSCESAARTLGSDLASRTVLAHLGNGCSVTAIHNGKSIENTMGLTPTGGVMMGTRSGDLDPGVLVFLLNGGYRSEQLDSLLNHSAGLLGVSGITSDMRALLDSREKNPHSRLAIEMFCYQIRKSIGALAAVLGGIDLLIFTGGIGEYAAAVRSEICSGLRHLGIGLDDDRNQRNASKIALPDLSCDVRIVEADEDREIALHARNHLRQRS